MRMILKFVLAAGLLPLPAPSPSADPCGTGTTNLFAALNRPTIGYSACSVKRGERVFEIGYSNSAQSNNSKVILYPQGFLRFGIAPKLEMDFIGPSAVILNGSARQAGLLDSGLGAKYEWFHDDKTVWGTDLLYTVPSGAAAFTAGAPIATINVDYARSLSPAMGLGVTVGAQSSFAAGLNGTSSRFFSALPSVVLTAQSSSRAQWYAEAFGQTRTRPDGGALYGNDAGLQYLLTPNIELDVEAIRTVTDLVRSHGYGFGVGVKF